MFDRRTPRKQVTPKLRDADERKADGALNVVLVEDGDLDGSFSGSVELPLTGDVDDERGIDLDVLNHAMDDLRQ